MTLSDAQTILHTLYEGDTDVPTSSDDDYTVRTRLFNAAIGLWEQELPDWRELRKTLASAATGTKTTTASTSAYATPTDFIRPLGWLRVTDSSGTESYYEYMDIQKVQIFDNDTTSKFYYVTGSANSGFYVNIHPTPDTSSLTISYEYYKTAASLSSGTDKFEMSDPYYAIYFALARLKAQDGEDNVEEMLQIKDRLDRMKVNNWTLPAYTNSETPDLAYDLGGYVFGE